MKILLLGKNGQLGWELQRTLLPIGPIAALDYPEIDFADGDAIRQMVREQRPDVIINAAAYTDVDRAESERGKAFAINATAPQILSEAARELGASVIHYSTDYVFDGSLGRPYTEKDIPNPLNVYAESKLAGEEALKGIGGVYLIFRTAWLYSLRGNSFVNKVWQWARNHETLHIVDDQVSNPTWARLLAVLTAQVLARGHGYLQEHSGLYHVAGGGYTSRFEWAREILRFDRRAGEQTAKEVLRAKTSDIPTPARRPLFSALNCDEFERTFGLTLPNWKQVLRLALDHESI